MSTTPNQPIWVAIALATITTAGGIGKAVFSNKGDDKGSGDTTIINNNKVGGGTTNNTNTNNTGGSQVGGNPPPLSPVPTTTSEAGSGKTEILTPPNGEAVDRTPTITGTVRGLATGESLWIYIYAPNARLFYPEKIETSGGQWTRSITLGSKSDVGSKAKFQVGLVIANRDQAKKLAEAAGIGASALPSGSVKLSEIILKRK